MTTYRHTQIGWAIIIPVVAVVGVVLGMAAFSAEARTTMPWVAGLMVVVLLNFCTLTVTVADGWLDCRFGLGLIWRRIRLSDVQRADPVRNKWYYGWGIRLTPYGWLWNVSGLDAVEVTFTDGRKFRIGTDDPEPLLTAIRGQLGSQPKAFKHD